MTEFFAKVVKNPVSFFLSAVVLLRGTTLTRCKVFHPRDTLRGLWCFLLLHDDDETRRGVAYSILFCY